MITVTGTYTNAAGNPGTGAVAITPDVSAVNAGNIITQAPVWAYLDESGTFTAEVVASDDPGWGFTDGGRMPYIITEDVSGLRSGWMTYLAGPGPVDLSTCVPLTQAPEVSPYLTRAEGDALYGREIYWQKSSDVLGIPDTWTEVNRLSIPAHSAGVYMFGVSLTWRFDTTNRSGLFRFSQDNGQTWGAEYSMEPGDTTDLAPFTYTFPRESLGNPAEVIMQARKETGQSGALDVLYCDLWWERVG